MFRSSFLSVGLHLTVFFIAFYGLPNKKNEKIKELQVEFIDDLPVSEKSKNKRPDDIKLKSKNIKVSKTKQTINSIKKEPKQKPALLKKVEQKQNLEKIPQKPKVIKRKKINKKIEVIKKKPIKRPTKLATKKKSTSKKRNQSANSILKTLAEAESKAKQNNKSKKINEIKNNLLRAQITTPKKENIDMKPSISEIDRIRKHVAQCYNLPYGTNEIDDKRIKLKISVNTDGSVQSTYIMDKQMYEKNSLYRAAADAARRAVIDCSPLPIPIDKYNKFKVFIFVFSTAFINS